MKTENEDITSSGSKRKLLNSKKLLTKSQMKSTSTSIINFDDTQSKAAVSSFNSFTGKTTGFSETKLLEFYRKLEREYSFIQTGFHGEQDW
jgi:hypothetical protein